MLVNLSAVQGKVKVEEATSKKQICCKAKRIEIRIHDKKITTDCQKAFPLMGEGNERLIKGNLIGKS